MEAGKFEGPVGKVVLVDEPVDNAVLVDEVVEVLVVAVDIEDDDETVVCEELVVCKEVPVDEVDATSFPPQILVAEFASPTEDFK
jgi:hypothetical protein